MTGTELLKKGGGCILLQKKIRRQSKLRERLNARSDLISNFMLKSKVEIHYSKLLVKSQFYSMNIPKVHVFTFLFQIQILILFIFSK